MAKLKDTVGTNGLLTDGDWILSENMDRAGNIGVIQLKHIGVGEFLDKDFSFIAEETFKKLKCTEVQQNDVLISRMAEPIARACIVPKLPFKTVTAVDVSILRVDENVADRRFVKFLCNSDLVKKQAEGVGRGTTRQRITRKELEVIEIPLPKPDEQKRIAAILDKADRQRRQRRFAQTLSDSFLQSVFIKMFGDIYKNEKNFEIGELGQKLSFMTSGSRGWAEHYTAKGDLFLRIQNVNKGELILNDIAFVEAPDTAEARRTKVKEGDVLLTITAALGRSAVIPKNLPTAYINQHIALLRVYDINPTFVSHFITSRSGQIQIKMLDREGVKSGLNFDDIKGIKILLPPLPLQEIFAEIVQKFERVRRQQREATRQAEHLFQTLLYRAFRGDL